MISLPVIQKTCFDCDYTNILLQKIIKLIEHQSQSSLGMSSRNQCSQDLWLAEQNSNGQNSPSSQNLHSQPSQDHPYQPRQDHLSQRRQDHLSQHRQDHHSQPSQDHHSEPSQDHHSQPSQDHHSHSDQSNRATGPSASQSGPSQSDASKGRVWKLQGGSMHVGACGKRTDRDLCMTLDLVFKFDGEPSSKVVGKF